MLLQGNLQNVFDALYTLGVIDPVLKMDWKAEFPQMQKEMYKVASVIETANENSMSVGKLMNSLKGYDQKSLGYLAMIVAQELVSFKLNKVLH